MEIKIGFQDFIIHEDKEFLMQNIEQVIKNDKKTSIYEGEGCIERFQFLFKNSIRLDENKSLAVLGFPSENLKAALILTDETPSLHSQEIFSLKMQLLAPIKKGASNPAFLESLLKSYTSDI